MSQAADHDWDNALARVRAGSPFLTTALGRMPDLAALLAQGRADEALGAALALDDADVGKALRHERLGLALVLGVGDLAGYFPLARVMAELSALGDRALDRAIGAAIARRMPDVPPQGFAAIALGKHGAGELNYSSDIDPILLYDPDTLPRRASEEPGEAAQRYARWLVELLSNQTGDGYVFRVDLRLRPASEVSPLAISFDAAMSHYESSALAWERAAYIRARAAGGDVPAGEHFLDQMRPFVWRRNLDFTAIEEIRRLTMRIRKAYDGPLQPGPGFDLKRGRGGIREVEFFAQTHQLIYGGRQPALRQRGTRAALDALATEGLIPADDAQVLGEAYDRLRVVEHRLQMVNDRQTHELPAGAEALDNVALLDGLPDGAALLANLAEVCGAVAARYDRLLGEDAGRAMAVPAGAASLPDDFARRVTGWKDNIRALRGTEARIAFDAIAPVLAEALQGASDPDRAMARWETLLARLPTAINLFRLFEQRPGLLEQVLRIITLAPPLADALARRVELLDALIDSTALDLPDDVPTLAARMAAGEDPDYEARLDHIRLLVGDARFALGVQLIEGRHDPLDIAEGLCRVAEAALQTGADAATAEFVAKHGSIADSELLVLGLGRLGGGALTPASDLDLVYLFANGPGGAETGGESDGPRPLTTSLYFNRLATRVTAALSVPTAEGALYEVDTRLRPQGKQGPLAVSLASFEQYQREDAWTWEHMALCRARPLYGSAQARQRLAAIIRQVLETPRDPAKLQADVLSMRAEMARHKPPRGPLDIKLLRGGLVDCEFLVHFLQLRDHRGLAPGVEVAIAGLIEAGLLPADFGNHFSTLARLLISARLLAPDGQEPPPAARIALAKTCGHEDYAALLAAMEQARRAIAAQWAVHLGEQLEI
ncbi:MAG TPA: bifunctional [glutamate--ammonia ligase]-adenylyl-L-tyrosine phosphorylase/[glutamate--ammonia-ligase] adenylyltransferase [Paracoccaceae bacterium]|nr:bifunctional [glutamate--ammonia ligase]-adenylyl-L-tyrosine phosphorylase/[glutamate--ammonia-ligase] adenylyltransferase [Paracoccaceae bacterium]